MPALNASPAPSFRRFSPRRVATTGPNHGSPYPKLDVRARLAARLIDVAIALIELIRARRHPLGQRLGDIWAGTQVIDGRDVRGEKARENAFAMLPAERVSQASLVSRTAEGARIILDGQRPIGPVKEPARQRP